MHRVAKLVGFQTLSFLCFVDKKSGANSDKCRFFRYQVVYEIQNFLWFMEQLQVIFMNTFSCVMFSHSPLNFKSFFSIDFLRCCIMTLNSVMHVLLSPAHTCKISISTSTSIRKICSHTRNKHKKMKNTHTQSGLVTTCLCLFHGCSHWWNKRNKHKHKHKRKENVSFSCVCGCAYFTSVNQAL